MKWRYVCSESEETESNDPYQPNVKSEQKSFELSFDKRYKDRVLESYIPHVLRKSKQLKEENKVLKLNTYG
ncbi:hypothetical protein MKW92_016766, partial [Papaver armeniacum]